MNLLPERRYSANESLPFSRLVFPFLLVIIILPHGFWIKESYNEMASFFSTFSGYPKRRDLKPMAWGIRFIRFMSHASLARSQSTFADDHSNPPGAAFVPSKVSHLPNVS
ncbi:hypothetical protein VNO77_27303 [Canavalia gladiata]|uniref:Uncharacterized protein n=1 Tax=Canavalia gladiata TaxID=3824 RepID=A0AAN9QAD7_CANGL